MPILRKNIKCARSRNAHAAFAGILFCLYVTGFAFGQSGRKISQPAVSSPPAPTQVSTPKPKGPVKPEFILKVIADIPQTLYQDFPKPEWMQPWTIERLKDSALLETHSGGVANRRDAIQSAKSETEAYVVLLQLDDDTFSKNVGTKRPAAGEVWITVTVFAPQTGKMKYSRRIVLNQDMKSNSPIRIAKSCHPGIFGNDLLLLQASIEAAEFVMNSFGVPVPPDCLNNPI